jgi:type I restriction enzyme R subunit
MIRNYSEDSLVEQPAIELFKELGWDVANCYKESFGSTLMQAPSPQPSPKGSGEINLGRETAGEVVLVSRPRPALAELNPELPPEAVDDAIEELTRDRSAMSLVEANRQIYKLLKGGVRVQGTALSPSPSPKGRGEKEKDLERQVGTPPSGYAPSPPAPLPRGEGRTAKGGSEEETVRVKVIDWEHPETNDFFLASQLWLTGDVYKRRADLIGFVNGLPLIFIELKKLRTEDAFHHNLRDYKNTIPKLFWYNAFIILSHGTKSLIGSMTAGLDHFSEWKKINDEGEEGIVSLETMIRGTCEPSKLLDLVENFVLFNESPTGLVKLIAKNHQYLGVNRAIAAVQRLMLRTPTPNPSPKGGGEEEELATTSAFTTSSSPWTIMLRFRFSTKTVFLSCSWSMTI